MTTQHTDASQREHELVLGLLPWHSEDTLSPTESAMVEKHLGQCQACQEALGQYRHIEAAFSARKETEAWQPSEAHFEHLLTMIDKAEQQHAVAEQPTGKARNGRYGLGIVRAWFSEPTTLHWVLGAETLALATLVLALAIPRAPDMPGEGQRFETLSNPAKPLAGACESCLHVVFADEITESEIRSLLQAVHGQLVAGPSSIGAYTVELGAADAAGEALGQAVKTLRANAKVRLAEPVSSKAVP
jgi:hypothetical protein